MHPRPLSSRNPVAAGVLLLLAVLLLGTAAPLPAQTPDRRADRFEDVRAIIRHVMQENELPSVVVAVAKDGRILWEEGFGLADRERQIPATPQTPYSLASISKPMTATAIMMLAEQGRIDLDRPVDDYLGEVRL
ncbi:MAG TPA: serine hydrolase domain-containing protein, partial [Longimicrobiaceae bacterium]|nr:serine hydrolase domain-containing protein [Longimicrobiaceae bacterium]